MDDVKHVSPVSIKADLGIAEVIRAVDGILNRRHTRKIETLSEFLSSVVDDLDGCSEIVKALDDFFIRLVSGFEDTRITRDPDLLSLHLAETRDYLMDRDLLPRLLNLMGSIEAASLDSRWKTKEYEGFASALTKLSSQLQTYRQSLGMSGRTGVGQMEEWNLETLCERALNLQRGGGLLDITLEEIAEQVSRNHDFGVSESIFGLIGKVRTQAKAIMAQH